VKTHKFWAPRKRTVEKKKKKYRWLRQILSMMLQYDPRKEVDAAAAGDAKVGERGR